MNLYSFKVRQPSPVRVPNPLATRAEFQEKRISEAPVHRKPGLDSRENIQTPSSYSRISQKVLEGFQKDFDDLFPSKKSACLALEKATPPQNSNHIRYDFMEHQRLSGTKTELQPRISPTILATRSTQYLNTLYTPTKTYDEAKNSGGYQPRSQIVNVKSSIVQPSTISTIPRTTQVQRTWKFDQHLEASPVSAPAYKKEPTAHQSTIRTPVESVPGVVESAKPVIPKLNLRAVSEDALQSGLMASQPQKKSPAITTTAQPHKSDSRKSLTSTSGPILTSGRQTNEVSQTTSTKLPGSDIIREAAEESKAMLARLTLQRSQQKTPDSEDSRHGESLQQSYPAPRSRDSGCVGLQQYNTFRPTKYETVESENSQPTPKATDWRPPQMPGLQKSHTLVQISTSNAILPNYVSFARDAESVGSGNYRTADEFICE